MIPSSIGYFYSAMMLRHVPFLKTVLLYSLTAFGGPQAHVAMMLRHFVHKRPYVTEQELLEYNAFCNLLPGASSTQTVTLIGYKRGGAPLAILTLIVWILPACFLMGAFSFLLPYISQKSLHADIFKFIPALVVGSLAYASIAAFPASIKNQITRWIMAICTLATYFFFRSPWIFPALIIASGIATNFSKKRIPQQEQKPKKVNWWNVWVFIAIFLTVGICSELARKQDWPHRKPINLFENLYRMGSFVFGGGPVLMPMMYEQFSVRPDVIRNRNPNVIQIEREDMTTGMGIVRAMPGPVFSIAAFTGGMALKNEGITMQVAGAIIGTIAIFLPSLLFVLFFFPIWNNLKKYAVIYRALEGINAAIVGVMIAATLYIAKDISLITIERDGLTNLLIIVNTFLLLRYTRIASPFLVLGCLLLGYLF